MVSIANVRLAAASAGVISDSESYTTILHDMMVSKRPDLGLQSLADTRELDILFPSVFSMVGFGGGNQGHKDLWDHTKKVVLNSPPILKFRWAALFHDVGKIRSYRSIKGKVSFHNHEIHSARIFLEDSQEHDLFDLEMENEIHFLILNLGKIESYNKNWKDGAIRRIIKDLGDNIRDLVILAKADVTTSRPEKKAYVHDLLNEFSNRVKKIKGESTMPLLPKGLGTVLIEELGVAPSEDLGNIMGTLKFLVENGDLSPRAEFSVYVDYVRQNLMK